MPKAALLTAGKSPHPQVKRERERPRPLRHPPRRRPVQGLVVLRQAFRALREGHLSITPTPSRREQPEWGLG